MDLRGHVRLLEGEGPAAPAVVGAAVPAQRGCGVAALKFGVSGGGERAPARALVTPPKCPRFPRRGDGVVGGLSLTLAAAVRHWRMLIIAGSRLHQQVIPAGAPCN